MKKILIAKVARPFGIKGECKIQSYTDFPKERFKKGSTVYLKRSDSFEAFTVLSYRQDGKGDYVRLNGVETMNDAELLRDVEIYKDEEDIRPLPKGQYYFSDLEGLNVLVDKVEVGFVKRVEDGHPANHLRVVLKDGSEHLVPFLPVFVEKVSLEDKIIEIKDIPGLL